jgi:hypothetical protein
MQDEMNPLDHQETSPMLDTAHAESPSTDGQLPNGEVDHEGAMAKADLYKLANYSFKLFKKIEDSDQLEAWVQAKITKAADYIASVYHYLEYEMKFSEYGSKIENSDMYSESQKRELKNMLLEAKDKVKDLKKMQADKLNSSKSKKVEEGMFGGEETCAACNGTGHVVKPERKVPENIKGKVAAYNSKARAMAAATKRVDKNKNGIPDDEEFEEDFDQDASVGSSKKFGKSGTITKTDKGVKHTRDSRSYSDEEHTEPKSNAKSRSADEKTDDKAANKRQDNDSKAHEKKFPGSVTRYSAGKKVGAGSKKTDDEDDVEEDFDQDASVGSSKKFGKSGTVTKTDKGVKHTRDSRSYSDEEHTEPKSNAKSRSADEKTDDKAANKRQDNDSKAHEKKFPGSVTRYSAGKKVAVGAKKEKDDEVDETYGQGVYEASGTKVSAASMWKTAKESVKVEEAKKDKKAAKDYDKDGEIESGEDEYKGSVDKAIKANQKETVKESADTIRIRQLMQRLNG